MSQEDMFTFTISELRILKQAMVDQRRALINIAHVIEDSTKLIQENSQLIDKLNLMLEAAENATHK